MQTYLCYGSASHISSANWHIREPGIQRSELFFGVLNCGFRSDIFAGTGIAYMGGVRYCSRVKNTNTKLARVYFLADCRVGML